MPGCVLRACGIDFDVEEFLQQSSLVPYCVHVRDQPVALDSDYLAKTNALYVDVADADLSRCAQILRAQAFLNANRAELLQLSQTAGVECLELDFGQYFFGEERVSQQFSFPPEFLTECAAANVGLTVTVYATNGSDADHQPHAE